MACEPTAQPKRGPTIWMEASGGTHGGATPAAVAEGVGVADGEGDGLGVGVDSGVALGVAVARLIGGGGVFWLSVRSCQAPKAITRPATRTPPAIASDGIVASRPCGRRMPCRAPANSEPARSGRGVASRRKACA